MSSAMTIDEWLHDYTANGDAQLVCAWRKRAWRVIRPLVERFVADRVAGICRSAPELLVEINSAREEHDIRADSKRWRQEHDKLSAVLRGHLDLWPEPTADEYAACLVAIDLVEQDDPEAARKLLDEQAPNRYSRGCRACGAPAGKPCRADHNDKWSDEQINHRIVPHLARVQPRGVSHE